MMSGDDKRIETTSEDWLAFSQSIEQFSKDLDPEELALLEALIAQAGAELDLLASESDNDNVHGFQARLHPGVNIMNARALANSYKTSFAKGISNGDDSTSVIWIE